MHERVRQSRLLKQGGKGVTLGYQDLLVTGRFFFGLYRYSVGLGGLRGRCGAIVDLCEWRNIVFECGLIDLWSVLVSQLFGWAFWLEFQASSLGLHLAGREDQKRQTEQRGDSTCCKQVGLRIKRWRFRRFTGHR